MLVSYVCAKRSNKKTLLVLHFLYNIMIVVMVMMIIIMTMIMMIIL